MHDTASCRGVDITRNLCSAFCLNNILFYFVTRLYELVRVEEDAGELVGGEEAGHEHRAVELLQDDAQVPAVLDL